MDALAQTLMKGAVNCDRHSDLQNSVNQLVVECGIRFGLSLKSCVLHCLGNSHGNMLMMIANHHHTMMTCCLANMKCAFAALLLSTACTFRTAVFIACSLSTHMMQHLHTC